MEKKVKQDFFIGVIVLAIYAIIGTCFGESVSEIMSYVVIMTLFGLSFNLQFGYAGMTSLGHAMYFGLGGYVYSGDLFWLIYCMWDYMPEE